MSLQIRYASIDADMFTTDIHVATYAVNKLIFKITISSVRFTFTKGFIFC